MPVAKSKTETKGVGYTVGERKSDWNGGRRDINLEMIEREQESCRFEQNRGRVGDAYVGENPSKFESRPFHARGGDTVGLGNHHAKNGENTAILSKATLGVVEEERDSTPEVVHETQPEDLDRDRADIDVLLEETWKEVTESGAAADLSGENVRLMRSMMKNLMKKLQAQHQANNGDNEMDLSKSKGAIRRHDRRAISHINGGIQKADLNVPKDTADYPYQDHLQIDGEGR